MSNTLVSTLIVRLAETGGEDKVNHVLAYGIGAIALGILTALMLGLLAFGRGRDHS